MLAQIETVKNRGVLAIQIAHDQDYDWFEKQLCDSPDFVIWARNSLNEVLDRIKDESRQKESLIDRLHSWGKIRFLVVCDENLGRSVLMAGFLRKLIKIFELDEIAEVVDVGTDVDEKKSAHKYPDGTHRKVIHDGKRYGLSLIGHQATQMDDKFVTPNTIIMALNDIEKLSVSQRSRAYLNLMVNATDPYGEDMSLGGALYEYSDYVEACAFGIVMTLEAVVKHDDMGLFRELWGMQN